MNVYQQVFSVRTGSQIELDDITSEVSQIVKASGLREGIAVVFSPHTTTALIINENEPRLVSDIIEGIKDLIDWRKNYAHNQIDNNAPAHLSGAFIGSSLSLSISGGQLELGTWQSIFLVELDGPRSRKLKVKVIGV